MNADFFSVCVDLRPEYLCYLGLKGSQPLSQGMETRVGILLQVQGQLFQQEQQTMDTPLGCGTVSGLEILQFGWSR